MGDVFFAYINILYSKEMKIAASVAPVSKPGKALKDAVNAPKKGKRK